MKKQLPADTQAMLDSLQESVRETLERKQKLGQYAIVGENGKIKKLTFEPQAVSENKGEYNKQDARKS